VQPGDVIAERFEVEALAGEGGMGALYRAVDRQTGALVAMKCLRGPAQSPARFVREARALAELRHPAIVRYVAHGTTPAGEPYLVMEWLEGEDLSQRLSRARLTIDECVELGRRIAGALGHAHSRGIVHRDLSPANLFLVQGQIERVKVLDFGLVQLRTQTQQKLSHEGGPVGTLGYMAPEQARGIGEVDPRADLFSLGCVLFECLTGRPPFWAEHYLAVLAKIVVADVPNVRELRPEVPLTLETLVSQMLAKDREQRPPSADSVVDALGSLHGSRPSLMAPSLTAGALGQSERLVMSVVLAGDQAAQRSTLPLAQLDQRQQRAREIAAKYGARFEPLPRGALVLTLSGAGAATDQAARAARCALALAEVLGDIPVSLATGWGEVRAELPIGEVIDHAVALLGERGSEQGVWIDEVTTALLPPRFQVRGTAGALALVAERDLGRPARRLLGRDTPCVGRERELRTLEAIVDECISAPVAHAVLLTGPAGIGKSRIRFELLDAVRDRSDQTEIWMGRGDPMHAGSPYAILAQALRSAIGLAQAEDRELQRVKLRDRVARHVPAEAQQRVSEFLGELLGLGFPDQDSVQLAAARRDASLMGDQVRRAFEDFLQAETAAHPVVLVVEDLQWGDLPTVKLIDSALRALAEAPLVVLAVARPEVHELFPGVWSERGVQEIRVGALTKRAASALVKEMLGELPAEDLDGLLQRASGNALYLEELIRAYSEGQRDALPDTVLAMVQARIEGMEPEARRVLRAAAIFGQWFWPGGVTHLLGGEEIETEVSAWLSTLEEREVVQRRASSQIPREVELTFRHALLREAAYAMLTETDAELGHRLAAEWLERSAAADAASLADHYEQGRAPEQAAEWWIRAASDALDANDFARALQSAERGVACGATDDALGGLDLMRAEALRLSGRLEEARGAVDQALARLERGGQRWCMAAAERALVLQRLGRARELEQAAQELLELAPPSDELDGFVLAHVRTALALLRVGERTLANQLAERVDALAGARPLFGPVTRAWLHALVAVFALLDGNRGRYLREAREALAAHEQSGDLRPALEQRISIGSITSELGDYAEAERLLSEALASAEQLGLSHAAAGARHNLGLVLARLGRVEEALELELRALEVFRAEDRRLEGGTRFSLALIHEIAGNLPDAEREALLALELLREAAPPLVPVTLAALASIRLGQGRPEEALALSEQALSAADAAGGMEYGESLIRLMHALALFQTGSDPAARGAIAEARRRLREQAAELDPELAECFLHRVPDNARILELAAAWLGPEP
jgi:eukaryotic-like serine/threonine-protein kinase